jgi:hypothetical protein
MDSVPVLHAWTQETNCNSLACAVGTLATLTTCQLTHAL